MSKPYLSPLILVIISLVFATVTMGRYIQDTDDRDKRQIGDLRTAEYLALITLNKMRAPSHCRNIACGLVDVIASGRKKRSADMFEGLNDDQKYRLLNILMSNDQYPLSS